MTHNMESETRWWPLHDCDDGRINTASGRVINLLDPDPTTIHHEDIATGLSNQPRFGGQMVKDYKVAQHCILVMYLAPVHLRPAALMHDAAEFALQDIQKPLKNILKPIYEPIERKFTEVIFDKYGIPLSHLAEIKEFDLKACELEHDAFQRGNIKAWREHFYNITTYRYAIWEAEFAKDKFLGYMSAFGLLKGVQA